MEVEMVIKRISLAFGLTLGALLAFALLPLSFPPEAGTLTITNTFADGTAVLADDFNQNFTDIVNVVNANLDDSNYKNSGMTGSTKIINDTISPPKLDSTTNPPGATQDNYVMTYDYNGGADRFKWVNSQCSTFIQARIEPIGSCGVTHYYSLTSTNAGTSASTEEYARDCGLDSTDCLDTLVPYTYSVSRMHFYAYGTSGDDDNLKIEVYTGTSPTGISCTGTFPAALCSSTSVTNYVVTDGTFLQIGMTQTQVTGVCDTITDIAVSFCLTPFVS